VKQEWSICTPKFVLENAQHQPVLRIEGPCVPCRCCADVDFQVSHVSRDKAENHLCCTHRVCCEE